jgi:hypothetical protein
VTSIKYARYRSVKRHYVAIANAHILRYGRPLTKGAADACRLKRFVSFFTRLIREGPKALSEFSHESRSHASLHNTNRSSARNEFLASTVGRAVWWEVRETDQNASVMKTVEVWNSKAQVADKHFEGLTKYMEVLPIRKLRDEEKTRWPLPNDHAVLEKSRRQGGNAAALVEAESGENMAASVEDFHDLVSDLLEDDYADVVRGTSKLDGPHPSHQATFAKIDEVLTDGVAHYISGTGKTCLPDGAACRRRYIKEDSPTPLKPLPLVEKGGKVRVVTLHPADEIHNARRLTSLWISQLRHFAVTRQMLTNTPISLEKQSTGRRKACVYSADLSRATDYIDHRLATHVGLLLCEKLGMDDEDKRVVKRMFGPHRVRTSDGDSPPTTRGIHMGLGPTWIILSLINSYAAWKAGARRETYAVCGDDLVGYWSRPIANRYEACLEEMGLVVNKSKSFFGKRGVFCERIVEQVGDRAEAHDVGHLSEITAAKLIARQTENCYSVAENLRKNTFLPEVSNQVRRHLIPRGTGPGRVEHGGNGFGQLTIGGLALLVKEGKVNNSITEDKDTTVVLQELRESSVTGHERIKDPILLSDAVIAVKAASQTSHYLRNDKVETRPISRKEWLARDRRRRKLDKTSLESLLKMIQNSSLSSKNKKAARHIISKNCHLKSKKKVARLTNILSRSTAERKVSRATVVELISKHLKMDWSEYLQKSQGSTTNKGTGRKPINKDIFLPSTDRALGGSGSTDPRAQTDAARESSSSDFPSGWTPRLVPLRTAH